MQRKATAALALLVVALAASLAFPAFAQQAEPPAVQEATLDPTPAGKTASPADLRQLPSKKVAVAPQPKAGDWVVRKRADGSETRMTVKEVRGDGTMIVMQGNKPSTFTTSWNPVKSYGAKTGDPVSYSPAIPMLSFPIEPGKSWGGRVSWTSGPYFGRMEVRAVAGEWTTIDVSGQKVEAIEINYTWDDGTARKCWYAPSVPYLAAECQSNNPLYAHSITDFGGTTVQVTGTR